MFIFHIFVLFYFLYTNINSRTFISILFNIINLLVILCISAKQLLNNYLLIIIIEFG